MPRQSLSVQSTPNLVPPHPDPFPFPSKARYAPVRGKIEGYHRVLSLRFFNRPAKQAVINLEHLQQLLDGVVGALYQPHQHRSIPIVPKIALADRVSTRIVPTTRFIRVRDVSNKKGR